MQALAISKSENRAPLDLKIVTVDNPVADVGEVTIAVQAIGLNPPDYLVIQAGSPLWKYPHIPGTDVAGTIMAVGAGVTNLTIGQRVVAHTDPRRAGTFAEQVVVDASVVAPLPDAIDFQTGAVMAGSALLAYQCFFRKINLTTKKTVLIHHAASAIGTTAIQLAKYLGLTVYVTAKAEQKPFLEQFKPDYIIDCEQDNITARVRSLTLGQGVDISLNADRTTSTVEDIARMATNGQIVLFNHQVTDQLNLADRSLSVATIYIDDAFIGPTLSQRTDLATMLSSMADLIISGDLNLFIAKKITFEQIPAVLESMRQRDLNAKVVATIN